MTSVNQKGQASVFVLALIGVILISTIFLFQSGRLTSEKMQLQNAADAAAIGASTLEARSLNFSAYTNRAMVANEVAIGQMVGMLSFVDELKTTGEYIDEYGAVIEAATAWLFLVITVGDVIGGIVSAIVDIMENVGTDITEIGEEAEQAMSAIISPLIQGLSIINSVYSDSQTAYHAATIVLVTTNILQTIEDNVPGTTKFNVVNMFDPNKPGAHLSDLGILALVGHLPSYWEGYTKRYTPSTQSKRKKSKKDKKKEKNDKEQVEKDTKKVDEAKAKVTKNHTALTKAQNKYTDDIKQHAKDKDKYAKKQQECTSLKQKWEADTKQKQKEQDKLQYTTCMAEQEKEERLLQKEEKQLKNDQATIKKLKATLKKDQQTLKDDQKSLLADEKKQSDDEGGGKDSGETNAGMQRMAATIREARDPFSSGGPPIKDKNIFGSDFTYGNRDWEFGLGETFSVLSVGSLSFFTGLDSKGGAELRYKGDNYCWSAIDTAVLEAKLDIKIKFEIDLFGFKIGIDIDEEPALGIPTGGGGYQTADTSGEEGEKNILTLLDMPPTLGSTATPKIYGGAGDNWDRFVSWEGAAAEMEENQVDGSPYSGLKPYRDMSDMDPTDSKYSLPFISPFFLVGVIRKFDDIQKGGPTFSGKLEMLEKSDHFDRMGSIAKSELYFNRPTTPKYFLRLDKKTEKPNVFSPFWQARLAKTSDIDRFLAMAVQHKIIWIAGHDAAEIPGMTTIKKDLEKLLNLF